MKKIVEFFRRRQMNEFIQLGVFSGMILSQIVYPNVIYAMWWDPLFRTVYESITGPVATAITGIVICITGIMVGVGEGGGAARRGLQFIFGLSLTLGTTQVLDFFRNSR